jgi:hypothetical protein
MENKYKKWYNSIICAAQNRVLDCYTETHHILPKSLGGTDKSENLIKLTAREHFICHILLTKITKGKDRIKMLHAVIMMKASNKLQNRYINSRLYEKMRIEFGKHQSKNMLGKDNPYYGKKHSIETRRKMSESKKGLHNNSWNTGLTKNTSEKLKNVGEKISSAKKGIPSPKKGKPGKPASAETKSKIKAAKSGKSYWWNNGIINQRGAESPGTEWKRGRLMSASLYASFCKKISD